LTSRLYRGESDLRGLDELLSCLEFVGDAVLLALQKVE